MTADILKSQNRWLVLFLLTLVYVFNFLDRQILGILAPFIAAELDLKDGQIGLLGGIYFAAFYTLIGIPVAWYADRANRVWIVSISLGIWSAFTAVSGAAQNFFQLSLARMGVGIGEAGGSPPSHAIISDLFDKGERSKALAIYSLGIPLGIMLAYFLVAYLLGRPSDQPFDWRLVFYLIGGLGVAFAVVVRLVIREPKRGAMEAKAGAKVSTEKVSVLKAIAHLLTIKSWIGMCAGISLASYGGYALSTFLVKYMVQAFPESNMANLYLVLGVLNGIIYTAGVFIGGAVCDRYGRKNRGAYAFIPAISVLIAAPAMLLAIWAGQLTLSFVALSFYLFFIGVYLGPSFSIAQTLAPISMRAMSTAIFFFILNMIAMGGGPTITGFLSDWFAETHGKTHGLRLALSTLMVPFALSTLAFLWTSRHLPKDWKVAEALNENGGQAKG
jgi:MFS family permease